MLVFMSVHFSHVTHSIRKSTKNILKKQKLRGKRSHHTMPNRANAFRRFFFFFFSSSLLKIFFMNPMVAFVYLCSVVVVFVDIIVVGMEGSITTEYIMHSQELK